jgi:hypothetical protein
LDRKFSEYSKILKKVEIERENLAAQAGREVAGSNPARLGSEIFSFYFYFLYILHVSYHKRIAASFMIFLSRYMPAFPQVKLFEIKRIIEDALSRIILFVTFCYVRITATCLQYPEED